MNKALYTNILFCIVVVCFLSMFFFLGKAAYISGGRSACSNTNSILVEGFKCEPIEYINKTKTFPSKVGGIELKWNTSSG